MKADDIFDGVTDVRDDLIDGAREAPKQRKNPGKKWWLGAVAAVLAVAILGGVLLRPGGGMTAYAIAQAEYPRMAQYPGEGEGGSAAYDAWWESVKAQRRDLGDTSALEMFFARSAQTFLTEEPGENRVYSPVNVYLALSMLAYLTDGDSRGQILEALGSGSMDELRKQANDVWNVNYRDDGVITSILASSLWLNENVEFNRDTMDALARDFYASSYRGRMGSKELNKALQGWLNEQTGGLLKEQAGNVELDPTTILALATTLYFKAPWAAEFSKDKTAPQTFHTPTGDVETDFLHQRSSGSYYSGDKFSAVSQSFKEDGAMWFLLPDEGVTPEELLADEEAMEFLFTEKKYDWGQPALVNKAIPKFDVSAQFELEDGLKALGITDVFDPERADFTPMTTGVNGPITLNQTSHAARAVIDEEGCIAAAFTVLAPGGDAPPEEEVDFVLDRPFVFCVTGNGGLPLFVGVVNDPMRAS